MFQSILGSTSVGETRQLDVFLAKKCYPYSMHRRQVPTISDVDVNELGEDAPIDHGTSRLGAKGSLLGTMVSLLLSLQSSTPEGQVGTASTVPERPCTAVLGIGKVLLSISIYNHDYC